MLSSSGRPGGLSGRPFGIATGARPFGITTGGLALTGLRRLSGFGGGLLAGGVPSGGTTEKRPRRRFEAPRGPEHGGKSMPIIDPTGADARITVPDHLVPKLRRAAALLVESRADELVHADLDTVDGWTKFNKNVDAIRVRIEYFDVIQAAAADPGTPVSALAVEAAALEAAGSATYDIGEMGAAASSVEKLDGLLDVVRAARELHALADEASALLEKASA